MRGFFIPLTPKEVILHSDIRNSLFNIHYY